MVSYTGLPYSLYVGLPPPRVSIMKNMKHANAMNEESYFALTVSLFTPEHNWVCKGSSLQSDETFITEGPVYSKPGEV